MTNTVYTEVYDLFSQLISDYRLTGLYLDDVTNSTTNFDTLVNSWFTLAIPDFEDICTQNLEDRNDTTGEFNYTLTTENKTILAQIMVKYWLQREVNDILQMRTKIQDRDFHTFSEQQNLTAKSNLLTKTKEEISQRLVDYGYKNADWTTWYTNNFIPS